MSSPWSVRGIGSYGVVGTWFSCLGHSWFSSRSMRIDIEVARCVRGECRAIDEINDVDDHVCNCSCYGVSFVSRGANSVVECNSVCPREKVVKVDEHPVW